MRFVYTRARSYSHTHYGETAITVKLVVLKSRVRASFRPTPSDAVVVKALMALASVDGVRSVPQFSGPGPVRMLCATQVPF